MSKIHHNLFQSSVIINSNKRNIEVLASGRPLFFSSSSSPQNIYPGCCGCCQSDTLSVVQLVNRHNWPLPQSVTIIIGSIPNQHDTFLSFCLVLHSISKTRYPFSSFIHPCLKCCWLVLSSWEPLYSCVSNSSICMSTFHLAQISQITTVLCLQFMVPVSNIDVC